MRLSLLTLEIITCMLSVAANPALFTLFVQPIFWRNVIKAHQKLIIYCYTKINTFVLSSLHKWESCDNLIDLEIVACLLEKSTIFQPLSQKHAPWMKGEMQCLFFSQCHSTKWPPRTYKSIPMIYWLLVLHLLVCRLNPIFNITSPHVYISVLCDFKDKKITMFLSCRNVVIFSQNIKGQICRQKRPSYTSRGKNKSRK